jgi:uncharacterized protein (DUF2236 family)
VAAHHHAFAVLEDGVEQRRAEREAFSGNSRLAVGTEPVSGLRYSANAPESQLWIHITGWRSNLLCYKRYVSGR